MLRVYNLQNNSNVKGLLRSWPPERSLTPPPVLIVQAPSTLYLILTIYRNFPACL